MWNQFGPGAVGVGWDMVLLGLGVYLGSDVGVSLEERNAWALTDEARGYMAAASQTWGEAYRAAGADPEEVAAGVAATTAFYAPPTG
jgi:hypothetical protein